MNTVVAAMEGNHPHPTNQKSFHLEIDRARDCAEIVIDDKAGLNHQLESVTEKVIATLEGIGEMPRESPIGGRIWATGGGEATRWWHLGVEGPRIAGANARTGRGHDILIVTEGNQTMKRQDWYSRHGSGRYKYLLLQQMSFNTRIHPEFQIEFPPGSVLVSLGANGKLVVDEGYAWNGATMCPDFETIMRGTLAHDALYQLMREGVLEKTWREESDRLLREICIADGTSWILAWTIFLGVRAGGWSRV